MAQGYSLHIGLNRVDPAHYQGWSGPLNACEADAASMEAICAGQGFRASRLLTAAATRDAVISALRQNAQNLTAGDILVVSYSGHGGQLPDLNGDENDDELDETWCLFDGELLDDELYSLWATFAAGVRIVVFSDSCHSGSVVRAMVRAGAAAAAGQMPAPAGAAAQATFRVMPPDLQLATYVAHQRMYDELLARPAPPPAPNATVILVSGCQDNQLSMDGPFNGAFTGALVATWRGGRFRGDYSKLTKAIRAKLPVSQSPNYLVVGQRSPSFEKEQVFTVQSARGRGRAFGAGSAPTRAGNSYEADATDCLIAAIVADYNSEVSPERFENLTPTDVGAQDDLKWLRTLNGAVKCLRGKGWDAEYLDSAEDVFGETLAASLDVLMG